MLEPINYLADTISKRARTKIVTAKSKTGIQSSEREKVPQIFGNSSVVAKKRSASKGKAVLTHGVKSFEKKPFSLIDISCGTKPSQSKVDGSVDGISSCVNVDDEKRSQVFPEDDSTDRKLSSPAKVTASETNEEAPEVKPVLSCTDTSQRKTIVLAISATTGKARKRKHKDNNDKSKKKHKTDKGKSVSISKQSGSKANTASLRIGKAFRKHKSVNHEVSASLSREDIGTKNSDVQIKDEVSSNCLIICRESRLAVDDFLIVFLIMLGYFRCSLSRSLLSSIMMFLMLLLLLMLG